MSTEKEKDVHFVAGVNFGTIGCPDGKPRQELPSLTHQHAEHPAPPAYGGPPKPPPAYHYGYGYGGGGSGGYGYPEPYGIWDEPYGAYGGGRYHPPQPPYYHGGGRGRYPSPQICWGTDAGGYSYHGGGGGGGGGYPPSSFPTAVGGGGGGGHGVSNAYGGQPQQKPHMSVGWVAAGAATAYGAYQHHMRKHHGGGGHGYRHGHGGDDDGCTYGGHGGYGRGSAPHMHMQAEIEHKQQTNIKYSAHQDATCNDAASGPPVTALDKCASQPTSEV